MSGAALSIVSFASCDLFSTNPTGQDRLPRGGKRRHQGGGGAREAPALSQLVDDGTIPRLGARLPDRPLLVTPADGLGRYGGDLRSALLGTDTGWLGRTIGYENLVRWDTKDFWGYRPNVAAAVEASPSGAEYVFRLRPDMRWSDGAPFDADDVLFAYNDVLRNPKISPEGPPTWMSPNGKPGTLTKVDKQTVKMVFATPNSLFMINLASSGGEQLTALPAHYLRRFHEQYNPKVADLVAKEHASDWAELFATKSDPWTNVDLPTLHGWTVTRPIGSSSTVIAQRNPYYWKVDPKGRQLPYVDRVTYKVIDKTEVLLLNVLNGDIDFHLDYFNTMNNKPVVARSRERGRYRIIDLLPGNMNDMGISLNLTSPDPVKREIFRSKDFRIGLSYAMNRQQIIETVFQQQGEPWQAAPRPAETSLYNERLAKQYTEHDLPRANRYLDRAGFTERDPNGFRTGPDGRRITFSVLVAPDFRIEHVDGMDLVKKYWAAVGVDVNVSSVSSTLVEARRQANKFDAIVWDCGAGWKADIFLRPYWYTPIGDTRFAPLWAEWYESRGASGERPPEPTRSQMEIYDEIQGEPSEDGQLRLMRELLDISRKEFYVIGTSLPKGWYGVAGTALANVPGNLRDGGTYSCPASNDFTQIYVEGV